MIRTQWGRVSNLTYGRALPSGALADGPSRVYGTNGPTGWTTAKMGEGPVVVIGRKGAYRGVHLAVGPYWVIDTAFVLRPGPDIDPRWAYYSLKTADINSMDAGSAIPSTRRQDFEALGLHLPPLNTQRAIAEVLGALDDKIAANDEVASTADVLVRGMFARLATSRERKRIDELALNLRVAAKPPIRAGAYIGLEHVPRRSMWLSEVGHAEGLASGKFAFEPDDVLFGKLRPYFHKVVVADRAGVCSTDILVVRAKRNAVRGYVWAALSSDEVVQRVSALVEGTRMPRTNWGDLASSEVPWPGELAAEEFSEQVVAVRNRVAASVHESAQLATLRDMLLPALMSGQITVREAEERVEESL